jgi:hypothetical protein
MSKQRHRRRSQGETTPETTPQTGSEVAHFSVSEVVQFWMSVDTLVFQSFFNFANPIVIFPKSLAMLAKRTIIFLKRFASGPIQIGLLALLLAVGCHSAGLAGVMGGVTPVPYPEAVERSRLAAKAVLERRGAEACLRGKLTGALLALSASCEAEARQTPLCALAERAVVSSDWRLATMDATALAILAQPA